VETLKKKWKLLTDFYQNQSISLRFFDTVKFEDILNLPPPDVKNFTDRFDAPFSCEREPLTDPSTVPESP